MDSAVAQFARALLLAVGDVVTFPWWWYTRGFARVLAWAGRTVRGWEHVVGLRLWAKNLLVPMYGQADWQGRLVSFFVRLAVLMGRLIEVVAGAVALLVVLMAYVVLPMVAVGMVVAAARS